MKNTSQSAPSTPTGTGSSNIYSLAKHHKFKGSRKSMNASMSQRSIDQPSAAKPHKTTVYGVRYPPTSDKLMKRWVSITHGSFPDYSKKPNNPALFKSSKVL